MATLFSEFPLATIARTLGVSRAVHYREPGECPRAAEDAQLSQQIQRIFHQHKKRYGSPRIHTQLRQEGVVCGVNRVARLMREAGLFAKTPKRKTPRTTDSRHGGPIAPNLLKDMQIDRPNQAWAMDITYIPQGKSWAYLAAVLDLYLHKVVGWDISGSLHADVVCAALQNAQRRQR
jgi:transposase InsO family protein